MNKTCKYCPKPEDQVNDPKEKIYIRRLLDEQYRKLCFTNHTSSEHEWFEYVKGKNFNIVTV